MAVIPEKIVEEVTQKINPEYIDRLKASSIVELEEFIEGIIAELHRNIDEKKRISYGITYVINLLSKLFYDRCDESFETGKHIYENATNFRTKSLGLGILSYVGIERPDEILPYFDDAASSDIWEAKEFAQMLIRKITKKYPEKVIEFLKNMAISEDADRRRFASESLRPVAENKWINDNPEFSLQVLRLLFSEREKYPKVSVGNNLSDLSRKNPELIYSVVDELMAIGNKNSEFIAHRACRNLVIDNPLRVMNALKCDEYIYKNRRYRRSEIEREFR